MVKQLIKHIALISVMLVIAININAQSKHEQKEGVVSYISSQNIYVKFLSTTDINIGDTLFLEESGILQPALVVNRLSSISCVCNPISFSEIKVNDRFITKQLEPKVIIPVQEKQDTLSSLSPIVQTQNSISKEIEKPQQKIDGRLSTASYSNFSNTPGGNSQRMRYTFTMNAKNISNSKFSAETYISFAHSNHNWDDIQSNVFNGLKIYNFAVKYQANESFDMYFGRKINPNISNIGAIDGLQVEKRFKSIMIGGFVGSRPNYMDYSYDANLFQAGAYVAHKFLNNRRGEARTTFAIVEQTNHWKTDRRFAYFQHYNTLAKNLYFFGTAELELFQNINGVQQSTLNLTNLYLMLRYRVFKNLSLSLSYSNRQNLIYYETYKDFVERLIDEASLQGYKFQINYRPFKYMSIGVRAGYRSRIDDPKPTKDLNAYLSYSRVPWIKASATLSATLLETAYLTGGIYSLHLSRDIIPGKLFGGVGYRFVNYQYTYIEAGLNQQVGDINITWKIIKKLSYSVSYEGVFEDNYQYNRVYMRLSLRF